MKILTGYILPFICLCITARRQQNLSSDNHTSSPYFAGAYLLDAGIEKIVFVKRCIYQSAYYYTDFIDGCEKFGGNLGISNWPRNCEYLLYPPLVDCQ